MQTEILNFQMLKAEIQNLKVNFNNHYSRVLKMLNNIKQSKSMRNLKQYKNKDELLNTFLSKNQLRLKTLKRRVKRSILNSSTISIKFQKNIKWSHITLTKCQTQILYLKVYK